MVAQQLVITICPFAVVICTFGIQMSDKYITKGSLSAPFSFTPCLIRNFTSDKIITCSLDFPDRAVPRNWFLGNGL